MTMLPDVPVEEWDQYQSDVFRNDTDQRIASLPLHVAPIRDDWMQPGAFQPPTPSDSLTNPLGTAQATGDTTLPVSPENQSLGAQARAPLVAAPSGFQAPSDASADETILPNIENQSLQAQARIANQNAGFGLDYSGTLGSDNSGAARNIVAVSDSGAGGSSLPAPDAPLPTDFGTHADARIASLSPPASPASASSPPAGQATSSTVNGVSGPPDLVAAAMNAADAQGLDPNLYVSLIQQESNFKPTAGSPVGAQGLAQLMPATARGLGVTDPWDPIQSLQGGARYLKQQLDTFGGDVVKALAAYNAGPGAVQKYGGIPPYEETQRYVKQVMGRLSDEPIDTSQITGIPGTYAPGPAEGLTRVGSSLETQQASGYTFPVANYQGDVALHWGDVPGGSDLFAPRGTPVVAMRGGKVLEAGYNSIGGNSVLIQGDDGNQYYYAHFDKGPSVKVGQQVTPGTYLGPVGNTGDAANTGTHLHIGIGPSILLGADKYGGTGGKFDAVGLLRSALVDQRTPQTATDAAAGPVALAPALPATPAQGANPFDWLARQKDSLAAGIGETASSLGQAVGGVASSLFGPQPAASQPMPSDALTNPLGTGNAPQPAAASSMTPPQPQQSVWDRVGQGISDVFKSAFGANQTMAPEGGGYGAVGPLQPGEAASALAPISQATQAVASSPFLPTTLQGNALQAAGQAISQSGLNELRSQYFPNITEPNHPINVLSDLTDKYASPRTGILQTQNMTPEDRQRLTDATLAIGGVEMPEIPRVGEAAAGVKVPNVPERPLPQGARPINLTPAEDVARLRLEDFPADVRPTIQQAAEDVNFAQTQRRGVIPDDVAQQMAQQYAQDTTLDQMIRQGAAGRAYNTEQIRALRNATAAQAVKVNDVAAAISKGDDSSAALANFFTEGQRLQRLVQISEGARAEAGRSLRAYQDPAQLVNLAPNDAVARITKMIGGDREKLLGAVQDYQKLVDTGAGPVQMAHFWSALQNPVGPGDWFKLVRYNSMLSGPRSIEVNVIGNALELPWRLARDTGASIARGRPEEIGPEVSGMFAGLAQANQRFMETLTQGITTEAAARGEIPRSVSARLQNPVAKGAATFLEAPGRLMGAADEWANAIAYNMGLGREAAVQATKEGLRGDAWNTRVTQILADPHTAPNLMQRADGIAQRMTYHGDMGNIGQGLQAFTQKAGIVGNLVLPFLRTVYHITARGIDRSPVGLVGTGIDVARGAYGRNLGEALAGRSVMPKGVAPLGERLGDNLMGSAVFSALLTKALDGQISAAGPDDQGRKALLQSEGWQPYSIHVGDKWISYANWGPAAIPFALAGATAEAYRFRKTDDVGPMVLDGMRRTAQVVQQQTYLQSIGAAWQGLNDPQRYGFQFVNNTIGSLIPYGAAINTAGQSADVYARRPDKFDIGDAIRNRLPPYTPVIGGRESVPTAQDVLGRPAPNTRAGGAALNPLLVSPERADPVLQELDRVGIAPPSPPQTVTRNGKAVQLTPDEQRQVQSDAGQSIADRVNTEIKAPSYVTLTDEAKAKRLQRVIDLARQQAENRFVSSLTDADYQKRVQQSQAQRQKVPVSGR